jgi:hypothetical protein
VLNLIAATWLLFTLPESGQLVYTVPDLSGDSIRVECSGGPVIRSLLTARLYGSAVTGGGFHLVSEHDVLGMEGMPDSFPVPWPGAFYVTTTNNVGESCASELVRIAPPDVTAVGTPDETLDAVVTCVLFDVHGRRVGSFPGSVWRLPMLSGAHLAAGVHGRLPSGVYWMRGRTEGGRLVRKRVVLVR